MTTVFADIILDASLNDENHDWRCVAGKEGERFKISGFLRNLNNPFNPRYHKAAAGESMPPPVAFGIFNGRPVAVLSDYLASIFPEGTEHHDWAWEHGKVGNRCNEYIISYCFPPDCKTLPGVEELRRRAQTDVRNLITESYSRPPVGSFYPPLGERTAEFTGPFDAHQGHWKTVADRLARGKDIVPFVDDVRTGIHEFPEAARPKAGFWGNKVGREADMMYPAQKKSAAIQFAAGASVVVGAILLLHGVTTAWKQLHQSARAPGQESQNSSPGSVANEAGYPARIGWRLAEAGTGAGLILAGVIGLYSRGR